MVKYIYSYFYFFDMNIAFLYTTKAIFYKLNGLANKGVEFLSNVLRGLHRMTTLGKEVNHSDLTTRLLELFKRMSEDEQRALLREIEHRLSTGRREHVRKPFFMVVDYSAEDRIHKDFIQNISVGGVFIETRMPFSVGQQVSLSFPLPNYQKYLKILGEVVRTSSQGIGVKFKTVDEDQEAMIKSLLEMI
jgi:uncharacterized protein (TIGR02266 family)